MNKSKLFYTFTISLLLISGALAKDQVNYGDNNNANEMIEKPQNLLSDESMKKTP